MTMTLIVFFSPFFVISVRLVQSDVFLLAGSVALSEPVVDDLCLASHR